MNKILGLDIGVFIALLTALTTIISSLITIIVTKLFENYQNTKKHKRIITEKVLDTKLIACKSAIIYYGTYLNYLYTSKYTFQNLENYEYSKLMGESQKFSEDLIKKIQTETNNEYNEILLFYDLYGTGDEEIAIKLTKCNSAYVEFIENSDKNNIDLKREKEVREKLVQAIGETIEYFKSKIKIVRDDLNSLIK